MTWLARLKALRGNPETLPKGPAGTAEGAFGSFGSAGGVGISDSDAAQSGADLYHGTQRTLGPEQTEVSEFLDRGTAETAKSTDSERPPGWVAGIARLAEMNAPLDWPPHRWPALVEDAGQFLGVWAAQAHGLGWSAWELWGCHRHKPWGRIQGMGLVLLLGGREIVALTDGEAVIRTATGRHQTHRRWPRDPLHPGERALIWEVSP